MFISQASVIAHCTLWE